MNKRFAPSCLYEVHSIKNIPALCNVFSEEYAFIMNYEMIHYAVKVNRPSTSLDSYIAQWSKSEGNCPSNDHLLYILYQVH
jgi:hypothetical protein